MHDIGLNVKVQVPALKLLQQLPVEVARELFHACGTRAVFFLLKFPYKTEVFSPKPDPAKASEGYLNASSSIILLLFHQIVALRWDSRKESRTIANLIK